MPYDCNNPAQIFGIITEVLDLAYCRPLYVPGGKGRSTVAASFITRKECIVLAKVVLHCPVLLIIE